MLIAFRKIFLLIYVLTSLASCQSTKTVVRQTPVTKNHVNLANQYARDGLLREAISSYKVAIRKNPKDLVARRNIGLVLVKIGDYKHAVTHLELAVKKFDRDFDTNFYLGEAYRGRENYAEAIFWYQKAVKIRPSHAKTLKSLAWSFFNIRFYSESLKTARKLYRVSPKDPQAAIIIVRTFLKLKRPSDAYRILKIAKQKAPKSSMPYLSSVEGDIFLDLNQPQKAARAYRSALKDQPLLAGALMGLGRCHLDDGDNKKAITLMERAARIRPKMTEVYYYLGQAYESVNTKKSIRYYQAFHKMGSTDPEFLGLLKKVKKRTVMLRNQL